MKRSTALLAVAVAVVVVLSVGGAVTALLISSSDSETPDSAGENIRAFEYSWSEVTTRQQFERHEGVCEGVLYCENPGTTGEWITVEGPTITRTAHVCASSVEEARFLVPTDAIVTGRELDPSLCESSDAEPSSSAPEEEYPEKGVPRGGVPRGGAELT